PQVQHVLHGPADHVEVTEPGELPRAAARADQAALLVEQEEGGVRSRVVVVEQLEQEAEAASLAALRPALEAGGALGRLGPVPAVRAYEDRHERARVGAPLKSRLEGPLAPAARRFQAQMSERGVGRDAAARGAH